MRACRERVFADANALITRGLHMSKTAAAEDRAHLQRTKSVGFRARPQEYEELAALRAFVLTLFGTTNPNLSKEEIDQVVAYADSVKRERVDTLMRRQA